MLSDYFTKSLQGRIFNANRRVLMGWDHISELNKLNKSSLKERVEFSPQNAENTNRSVSENFVSLDSPATSHKIFPRTNIQSKTFRWKDDPQQHT